MNETPKWLHSSAPRYPGVTTLKAVPLAELVPLIDWSFFFRAWEMKGRYPEILQGTDAKAEEAHRLYADGQIMLQKIITENQFEARAVIGFFPVQRKGDSLDVLPLPCDCGVPHSENPIAKLHFLRQQIPLSAEAPCRSLADYFNPKEKDWIGLFALSVGFGVDSFCAQFRNADDSYSAILAQSLADRLTEAFAEKLHADVRQKYWGYAPDPDVNFGIRPAPGYPACPDHTEKGTLWQLLQVEERIGIRLTESYMMLPVSSICGYYMAHPKSTYFSVGKLGDDQVRDYAARKGWDEATARKWLVR